jgi:deoxycytidylate deaminase
VAVTSEQVKFVKRRSSTRDLINVHAAKELIFAVVGPVGSGTTEVAVNLAELVRTSLDTPHVIHMKASDVISRFVDPKELQGLGRLERAKRLQNAGDELRKDDEPAIGALLVAEIKSQRALFDTADQAPAAADVSVLHPKNKADLYRVYIIDSLKHPAEVELLRAVYREAFCLVGVVCEEGKREERLRLEKCKDSSLLEIQALMKRDEDAVQDWGQKVSKTFHMADFFIDNTPDRFVKDKENPNWVVPDKLGRLVDVLIGNKIVRPLPSETGMFHANGAQLRSACLSRQVGAALTDGRGNVLATGTNEVPKPGGGVYGGGFEAEMGFPTEDHRCAVTKHYCSNTRVQGVIMDEVIEAIKELRDSPDKVAIKQALGKTSLGRLLEFSRAVHAEMDAILSATRAGSSTVGAKLFVTTFPCHYCARHIVSAGIDEVQFIEPYPKSRAFELHGDAIERVFTEWYKTPPEKPEKVLFRPFAGVAPRLYARAFLKNKSLKNDDGVQEIGKPKWAPGLLQKSYLEIEKIVGDEK